MLTYEKQTWEQFDPVTFTLNPRFEDPVGAVHEDIELIRCTVNGGALGNRARHPEDRTIVRRVRALDCRVSVDVGPVIFEDVDITNLRTGSLWVSGAVFKHVTLAGRIGELVLGHERWAAAQPGEAGHEENIAFDLSAEAFYRSVDWALDISRAEFRSLDWRLNLPSRLVRRAPETQIVVKRERLLDSAWQKLPLHPLISIALSNFVDFNLPERILAAPKASKSFKDELASIELLRKEGIAEPD